MSLSSRERFLAACAREPLDAPPGWVMRQAGRYLPEYRAIREGKTFLEMCRAPEIAAEITLQPLRRFDMDAAVIFSDILVPPAAMGIDVNFVSGRGPVLEPTLRETSDIERLRDFEPREETAFVGDAIRNVRAELGDEKAIIGFCGAPFTTASYMIEGGGSRNFENTKRWMYSDPAGFGQLLGRVTDNLIPYLAMQVEAGADVLQVFESWGGTLDADTYRGIVLPHVQRLIAAAKTNGVPVVLYANGASHLLETFADAGPDMIGVDWRIAPEDAIRRVGDRVALQGNLDPCALFAPPEVVEEEVRRTLDRFAPQKGYVFNLGSGILPPTPTESMEAVFRVLRARRQD
jgi:uroporphyrinogen decarboxylase